jgi:exosortase/archaeosortase family protein
MAKKKTPSRKKKAATKKSPPKKASFDLKAYWQSKSPILRFFLIWAGLTAIFYVIWYTDFFKGNVIEPWNQLNAWVGAGLLSLMGQGTSSLETVISGPGASINIKEGCDAIEPTILFIFGVLAFPAFWKFKLKGILYGTLFLLGVNFFRIITLYFSAKYWPAGFEFMHIEFWQVLYVLLAIGAWGYWLYKSIQKENEN